MSDIKLSKVQEAYVKKMEREKVARETALIRMKRRNRGFLFGGLAAVFSICKLTAFAIVRLTQMNAINLVATKSHVLNPTGCKT